MDPFTFLIFALLAVAAALAVTSMMKRPRTRRKATIVPPKPTPAQPDLWPEFSEEHERIRNTVMARLSNSKRTRSASTPVVDPRYPVTVDPSGVEIYTPVFYVSPEPVLSYSAPDPEPTPTFGGGDSGGAGASDSWSSSSSSDTSSSYDSSSSSCDSSSSGSSD